MLPGKITASFGPVQDTDEQLRQHILWFLFIRVLLFTILLGLSILLQSTESDVILPPRQTINIFIIFIYLYSIGAAILSLREVLGARLFGMIQLLSDVVFVACLVYGTGCSQSIFTVVFIYPIIAGGLILRRMGGLIPAALATLLYGGVLYLELRNIFPRRVVTPPFWPNDDLFYAMNLFSVYGLAFFLSALLSGMLASRLRRAEQALDTAARSLDRLLLLYKQIFEDVHTGIITVDDHDRITSFNPAAERITGYGADQVMERKLGDRFPEIVLVRESGRLRTSLTRRDGAVIRVDYSFTRLHPPERPGGKETDEECGNCKVITLTDISKLERMEQQVRQAEKMAAIGEMSAAIAHDLRNPLAAISGSAQILSAETAGSELADLVEIILRESSRMSRSIDAFLQFAQPAEVEKEWFNLRRLSEEVADQAKQTHPDVEIINLVEPGCNIWGDRQMIHLALRHLVDNACQALSGRGGRVELDAAERGEIGNGREQDFMEIRVRDNGPGIDLAQSEELFKPYFTTREKGTGLGLAIVRQVITSHGGRVWLHNRHEGSGCQAVIQLPLP